IYAPIICTQFKDFQRFSSWFIGLSLVQLRIVKAELESHKIFNEQFISDFADNGKMLDIQLSIVEDPDEARFVLSRESLDIIQKYDRLVLASIAIPPLWLVDLINQRLDLSNP
ncbi:hypothetical protein PFISCL1PPCAC_22339, partial [Pristionchus fissidentatus]